MLFHVPDSAYAAELRFVSDLQDSLLSGLATADPKPADLAAWVAGLSKWSELPIDWIHDNFGRSNSIWGTRLSQLLDAQPAERQSWLVLAQSHRRFSELYRVTPTHRVDGSEWRLGNLKLLGEVLIHFYDRDIPIPAGTSVGSTAHTWLRFPDIRTDFAKKVSVCPYTGESLNISGLQLDHFLPKSRFPALSCDPENLVPCVGAGNRVGQKGEIPPITLDAANQAVNWLHPRIRPGLQKSLPDRICLKLKFPRIGQPTISLAPTGTGTQSQVDSLESLFHLSRDWTFGLPSRLEGWNEEITTKWAERARPATAAGILEVISEISAQKQRRRFIEPDAFLDAAVLEAITADPDQIADLVRRVKSAEQS
jgi:hypothetical protein